MLFEDDEEKKKREEEAKSIISMNTIGNNINSINYANSKNINIETQDENERQFINKVNEANRIINSINPRKDIEIPSINEEDIISSQQNTKNFLDLIDRNVSSNDINKEENLYPDNQPVEEQNQSNINQEEIEKDLTRKVNTNFLLNSPTKVTLEQDYQKQPKTKTIKEAQEATSSENLFSNIGKIIENTWLGIINSAKSFAYYIVDPNHTKEQETTLLAGIENNKNIPDVVSTNYRAEQNQNEYDMINNKNKLTAKLNLAPSINNNTKQEQKALPLVKWARRKK